MDKIAHKINEKSQINQLNFSSNECYGMALDEHGKTILIELKWTS